MFGSVTSDETSRVETSTALQLCGVLGLSSNLALFPDRDLNGGTEIGDTDAAVVSLVRAIVANPDILIVPELKGTRIKQQLTAFFRAFSHLPSGISTYTYNESLVALIKDFNSADSAGEFWHETHHAETDELQLRTVAS